MPEDEFSKKQPDNEDDESGSGGQSGHIEFRDFIGGQGALRDDQLPFEEKKRLLSSHNLSHEGRVKKQKELRQQRKDVKEGKIPLRDYKQGLQSGMSSQYRAHPTLKDKAQFSGIDRQVSTLPTENVAETNDANRNELENQYRLKHQHQPEAAPKFNPKPQIR